MNTSYSFGSENNLLNKKQLFILSVSSMIGIGVFIKSKTLSELSNFSFPPIIALFVFSAILISSMIYLFTKLINTNSSSGRSFIEWVENYCGHNFKMWAVRFTKDFVHPLGILTTSLYLIKWIAGNNFLWVWESIALALVIAVAMMSLNIFSFRISELFQRALFLCIILSLLFVATAGIISYFSSPVVSPKNTIENISKEGFNNLGGWTILISGLPSIFFMYDGFYSVLSLKEQTKAKTSFTKTILYSLYTITAIYLLIIVITLLGDSKSGDFLNFPVFKDKTWKDVLKILILLTFASSLNIACMCGQNQLIQLHYKYNFKDLNHIRKKVLNKGKNLMNFNIEVKLSVWLHLIKKMVIYSLLIALVAQIVYWSPISGGGKKIFWEINDMLAELVSLFIFGILAVVIWKGKNQNNTKFLNFLHYLVSFSIFGAISYFLINTAIDFIWSQTFLSWLKVVVFSVVAIIPAIPYLKINIWQNRSEEKILQFKRDNPLVKSSFSK